jgi:hypothetical protein
MGAAVDLHLRHVQEDAWVQGVGYSGGGGEAGRCRGRRGGGS